ncbi:DUF3558 domain-containing protein [Mycobacterium sp. MYCO198283]|uniref:DUF3558 domain-containing protein n=1 Tax=Mycobacterium sp. MYCO198283 TaxID=2883505 RepID=UPI0035AB83BD
MSSQGRGARRRRTTRTWAGLAVVTALALSGCGSDDPQSGGGGGGEASGNGDVKHGPFFPVCGGVGDDTVGQLTQVRGLIATAKNSVGCQWLVQGSVSGPHFSFSWFRGSPIGRERKTEELTRTSVEDVEIEGHSGFIAVNDQPGLGKYLCEIGIQFDNDFIEWSISFNEQPFPDACNVARELTAQSIRASK